MAGVLDAKGYINTSRGLYVGLRSYDLELLLAFQTLFGGTMHKFHEGWQFHITDKAAYTMLLTLKPFIQCSTQLVGDAIEQYGAHKN